jgi:hypothetical protein
VHDLYINKIAPQIREMQATTAKARAQLQASFDDARTSTENSIATTVTIQEIIAALTLLCCGCGRKSEAKPSRKISQAI